MNIRPEPTQETLRSMFRYDGGRLLRATSGKNAGTIKCGGRYWSICVESVSYRRSRLVWVYHNGPIPEGMIVDHIDGDGLHDEISNLRLATMSQNQGNTKLRKDNTSGAKGVYQDEAGKWCAHIRVNGKRHWLGRFDYCELAKEAYRAAAAKYFGIFATTRQGGR